MTGLYIILFLLLSSFFSYMIYEYNSIKEELELTQYSLKLSQEANKNLNSVNEALILRHKQELQSLSELEKDKQKLELLAKNLNKKIYTNQNSTSIVLFNEVLDELFEKEKK